MFAHGQSVPSTANAVNALRREIAHAVQQSDPIGWKDSKGLLIERVASKKLRERELEP